MRRADEERRDALVVALHLRRRFCQGSDDRELLYALGKGQRTVVLEEDNALLRRGECESLRGGRVNVGPSKLAVWLVIGGIKIT